MGDFGTIAGGHKDTVDAAENILKDGGNSFDAAVAGVFVSFVAEFLYTGPAGGGALLACQKNRSPVLFDFFVESPAVKGKRVGDFQKIVADFGDTQQNFHIGMGSVGVPGALPGLIQIHKKLGRLPFSVLVEQAVFLAKRGTKVSKNQEYLTSVLAPVVASSEKIKKLFLKDGKLLRYGDRFYNPEMGSFLESFLHEDPESFYRNEVCPLFFESFSSGRVVSLEDLLNYKVKERVPLFQSYGGCDIFTNPLPSTGGTMILGALKTLEKKIEVGPEEIEKALISAQLFNNRLSSAVGSTTHLSIIDKNNNVASVTTTNGVGAGKLIGNTGVMPNNMLGEEHLNPFGFHAWPKKQRIPSNIAPTIVFKNGKPVVAVGSAGSSRIISAVICVLANLINNKMSIEESIVSPRLHIEDGVLHHEPFEEKGSLYSFESKDVVSWKEKNMYFGGVNAAGIKSSFGDDRRSGYSR